MRWVCRLVGHRWQYHGYPEPDRRVCVTCETRETWADGRWG